MILFGHVTVWQGINLATAIGCLSYIGFTFFPRPKLVLPDRFPMWLALPVIGLLALMAWLFTLAVGYALWTGAIG